MLPSGCNSNIEKLEHFSLSLVQRPRVLKFEIVLHIMNIFKQDLSSTVIEKY